MQHRPVLTKKPVVLEADSPMRCVAVSNMNLGSKPVVSENSITLQQSHLRPIGITARVLSANTNNFIWPILALPKNGEHSEENYDRGASFLRECPATGFVPERLHVSKAQGEGAVEAKERLSGLLKYYYRRAA